jgi:Dolichyl-phosphate-mannose-protein mannosyltransferase
VGVLGQDSAQSLWLGLRNRPVEELRPLAGIAVGLLLGLISLVVYIAEGYSQGMLWIWLAALVVLSVAFWLRSRALPRIALADVGIAGGLVLLVSPLYLLVLSRWPVQVSSDEIAIMDVSKQYASQANVDPFGVSWYLTRPAGLFVVWGDLGELIGGIDLFHMRLLHAVVGLVTVAVSYALFRLMLPRWWAAFAAALVAASHSMFMLSRLAMRENTALLAVVLSFMLLLWGLQRKHELATFLGGVVAGLGFYVYFPGRVALPIWLAFLLGLGLLYKQRFPRRTLLSLGAIATAGALLTATPILYAESQVPSFQAQGQRDSLLIYDAAREEQKRWEFEDNQWDAYKANVRQGLGTFNNNVVDHAWIYPNYGHGFVDPLTGILLWVGVGVVGIALIRRRREDEGALLMLGGFLVLWLSFAFVVNKAPNYTRLLVTLPFVAFLVAEAVRWLAGRWRSISRVPAVIVAGFLSVIVVWNLAIAWDYIQDGRRDGEPIGSTGRYVEAHKGDPGKIFYVATSAAQPYYVWGDDTASMARLKYFADNSNQVAAALDPVSLRDFNAPPPFSLFMRREVWQLAAPELAEKYPRGRIRNITPDGARVVLEVPLGAGAR